MSMNECVTVYESVNMCVSVCDSRCESESASVYGCVRVCE